MSQAKFYAEAISSLCNDMDHKERLFTKLSTHPLEAKNFSTLFILSSLQHKDVIVP